MALESKGNEQEMFEWYCKKNNKNLERQRNGYWGGLDDRKGNGKVSWNCTGSIGAEGKKKDDVCTNNF